MSNSAVVEVDGSASWSELAATVADQSGVVRVAVVRLPPRQPPVGTADDDCRATVLEWLRRPDLLSIAVVTGVADASSLTIAAHCDVLLAADDAVFSAGSAVEPGLIAALVERVGLGTARSVVLAGRSFSGPEAASSGLVDFVAPADQLETLVDRVVNRLLSVGRDTATELKSLLRRAAPAGVPLSADFDSRDRLAAGPALGAG